MKKKRGAAYVYHQQKKAVKQGQLPRFRRLRLVRRTRFNSRVACLDSFLLNVPLLRRISTSQAFADCMKVSNPRKKERQESSLRTWQSDTLYHRARRALLLTGPAAVLTRLAGGQDFFSCHAAWLRCRKTLLDAQDGGGFHGCRAKAF